MCAAPGGKTTQISALTGGEARITACEMHVPRAERLEFNLARQGARNVTVMRVDARRLDDYFSFDQILVDAPCSGSGTLDAADPKMPKRFTPTLVEKSVKAQRALLAKALRLLKPGGAARLLHLLGVAARERGCRRGMSQRRRQAWALPHRPHRRCGVCGATPAARRAGGGAFRVSHRAVRGFFRRGHST